LRQVTVSPAVTVIVFGVKPLSLMLTRNVAAEAIPVAATASAAVANTSLRISSSCGDL
jgi:hypothetical protein